MKYYLDCEFDGLNGPLISMGLIREDGKPFYAVTSIDAKDEWVQENVIPKITQCPLWDRGSMCLPKKLPYRLFNFLEGDTNPLIISDWPDDIKYFCAATITAPGYMIAVPSLRFEVQRVDAYPCDLPDAVQHNAYWDAMALWWKIGNAA